MYSGRWIRDIGGFDEEFSYSMRKDSGFGWEDVDIGVTLYEQGNCVGFVSNAISIHTTHMSLSSSDKKALGSAKNFANLIRKHPELPLVSTRWAVHTSKKIVNWGNQERVTSKDFVYLSRLFANEWKRNEDILRVFEKAGSRPRILSHCWHIPHQYELYKLPLDVTLVTGIGPINKQRWDTARRPLPDNVSFIDYKVVDPSEFDLAITHFDENVMCTSLSNEVLPPDWGSAFSWFLDQVDLPLIAICHGTPPFVGQYRVSTTQLDKFSIYEFEVEKLRNLLKNVEVVCNSYQAYSEWGFEKSRVIWHGMDPQQFPRSNPDLDVISHGEDWYRPHYRGTHALRAVAARLDQTLLLSDHSHPGWDTRINRTEYAQAKNNFRAWVDHLRRHKIYLNTTLRSPMPRSRTEAMLCGVIPVCLKNHDVERFIELGENGFFSDQAQDLADFINEVCKDESLFHRISSAARETALRKFNHVHYLKRWMSLLSEHGVAFQ
jgi:glycosyltransferase involved in cell wall biosynthesis